MADAESPPECFICTESEPRPFLSACLCKDRYMHTGCFYKMLKAQKGEPKCGVCGALYEDVGWKTRRIPQFISLCGFLVLQVCTTIALTSCAANTLAVLYRGRRLSPGAQAIAMGFGIFLAVVGLGALGCIPMTIRHYGWRAVWASRYREEKVIVLGAVRLPKRTTLVELDMGELATAGAIG